MRMDVYSVINEAKKSPLFSQDEIERLFSLSNDAALYSIVAADDEENESEQSKMAAYILKRKDDYWEAKRGGRLDGFISEFNKEMKKLVDSPRLAKERLFAKINEAADSIKNIDTASDTPNEVFFKLFLKEYNNKYAFTWKAFKEAKRNYEKSHPVEGEDIYVLKSLLEKDPKIDGKITNQTVFCKAAGTLSKRTIEKLNATSG